MGLGLIIQRRSHFPSGRWPECSGMGGRNQSESVAGMRRNTHLTWQGFYNFFILVICWGVVSGFGHGGVSPSLFLLILFREGVLGIFFWIYSWSGVFSLAAESASKSYPSS
jgi:hypothetical protein